MFPSFRSRATARWRRPRRWPPSSLVACLGLLGSLLAGPGAAPAIARQPAALPPPAELRAVDVRDRTVTLTWRPSVPATGSIEGYVVEGGFAPGQVLGALPTTADVTTLVFDAPADVLFVRVRAIRGSETSAPSNELRVAVGASTPPSPPEALLGAATGSTLTLSWTRPIAGGTPERWWLLVSGTLTGALAVPGGESLVLPNVPDGTYTMQLVAENAAGTSTPSNPVTLTFPGTCSATPAPPRDFHAWRDGARLSIAWNPPASGAPVTSYSVQVAGAVALSFPTTERLVSAEAPAGNYVVSVVANTPCGPSQPAPAAPAWTTVAPRSGTHRLHWPAATPAAGVHRVFWSTSRAEVEQLTPSVPFVDVHHAAGPVDLTAPAGAAAPVYYRVAPLYGPVAGTAGPVALAPTFLATHYAGWPANVTPALYDVDGDGCLDMVGARGRCAAGFERYEVATAGLGELRTDDAKNRDSRFADFTGDGIVDIFTNVYARADDTAVEAVLHVGRGDGTYQLDPGVAAMDIRGYGETVLAADFDNDGDIDLFLPHYTHLDDGGRNRLLVNDGAGHFTDVAQAAGVALNLHFPPEGAQALDWDADGWIDIHVASHLFRNNGDLTFTDIAGSLQMPVRFDEGLRLFDVDLDGDLDLVHHDTHATRLHVNDGTRFETGTVVDGSIDGSTFGFGLNVCDVNGDGFEDLLVSHNDTASGAGLPHLLVNAGGRFELADLSSLAATRNDLIACADVDGSGLPDVVSRWSDSVMLPVQTAPEGGYRTYTTRGEAPAIRLRVVDATGARNQQGRPVRLRPRSQPGVTLLRMVESGSGYMAQNGYDLLVSTPWTGTYDVEVRTKDGWVRTVARPGDVLTIYEDGRVLPGLR